VEALAQQPHQLLVVLVALVCRVLALPSRVLLLLPCRVQSQLLRLGH
jgi:hypothetical protein